MKDCDNMAKGFLDALEGYLYENDRQVDHLDLIRLRNAADSSGHVLVNHSPTNVSDHSDVIHPRGATILWMTAESLQLDKYLSEEDPPAG